MLERGVTEHQYRHNMAGMYASLHIHSVTSKILQKHDPHTQDVHFCVNATGCSKHRTVL